MAQINITELDAAFIKIDAEPSILQELREYFTFRVPGAEFHPSVRNHMWDGKIRLLDTRKKTLYSGLKDEVLKVAKEMGYTSQYTPKFERPIFTEDQILKKAKDVGLTLDIRPYQITAILNALNSGRQLMLSPTASGKSMIIYMICRMLERKTLIIVPTTALVEQMTSDFADYGYDSDANVHKIYYGKDRQTDKMITVTTWQTLAKQPEEYFKQFDVVIGDECLHPDTEITMADNTTKKIKDIQIGDMVMTFNEETKQVERKKVVKVHENISIHEDFYEVETLGSKIKITGNHKVLLETGVWKRVDELEIGDIINTIE